MGMERTQHRLRQFGWAMDPGGRKWVLHGGAAKSMVTEEENRSEWGQIAFSTPISYNFYVLFLPFAGIPNA